MATRTALITGASRGIGLAIAERLLADGFDITISARDPEKLAAVAERLRERSGRRVVALAGELGDPSAVEAVTQAHHEAYGAMSALVLNAGVGTLGSIGEIPMNRFQKVVDLNLRAPLHYLQQSLPLLRKGAEADEVHGAKVVALASITGVFAEPQLGIYGATKAALSLLIDTLNIEQSASGITGTSIAPAYVDTDMAAWKHGELAPESMIPTSDVAELVGALVAMNRRTLIGQVVMARSGSDGRRA
ncbi:SDR family NAD(P)-dependent oxidoreductase [Nocardia harenae]|uniref:SDR family NAD(P)-dependent oxidoreductase n=1 Tax=Nocardia harenae TaxID=358707 RepID=UPI00082A97AA|nr:SDR family oxidoreductase [Nocardia harenae]